MDWSRLYGEQYVRLAPGAAEKIAPFLGVAPGSIDELVLSLPEWPEEIKPRPRPAQNGRLVAGDPILLDAGEDGLVLSGAVDGLQGVLVPWEKVRSLQVLGGVS